MPGPDQSVSIDFNDLYYLVDGIRKVEDSLGCKKEVHKNEKIIRDWAFRSVVSIVQIKKGDLITEDMVWTKRPGTGIPSKEIGNVIGKVAKVDIPNNVLIKWEDLENG